MYKDIMISIIVPVYQGEQYIKKCINCIQRQMYSNLEIIVVNDGSTDDTSNILDSIAEKDDRIVIVNQNNQGVSAARNMGLRMATGKYVMFVDSDDEIDEQMCKKMIEAAVKSESDVVIGGFIQVGKHTNLSIIHDIDGVFIVDEFMKLFEKMNNTYIYQSVCGKLYKKEILSECKFDSKMRLGEDLMFNYQVYKYAKKWCVISYAGYRYVLNEHSATHKFNDMDFEHQKLIRKEAINYYLQMRGKQEIPSLINDTYVGNCLTIMVSLVTNEEFIICMNYLKEYLNDDFFLEKLKDFKTQDSRLNIMKYMSEKKWYHLIYVLGKINKVRRKLTLSC